MPLYVSKVADIVRYIWNLASFDIHIILDGQFLTIAATVHTHACLTAPSKEQKGATQVDMIVENAPNRI